MEDADLDHCLDRIRHANGKAYYDLDKLLKGMGLSDEQVLAIVNEFQPMLKATEDRVAIATLWERQTLFHNDGEWIATLEREAQETCRRYADDIK
jgi:hypothetical protein